MSSVIKTQVVNIDGNDFLNVVLGKDSFNLPFKMIAGRKVAYLDISGQVSLIESCADMIVEKIVESGAKFDAILNPVSKSNALAHAVAVRLSKIDGYNFDYTVVARKAKGGETHKVDARYRSVTTTVEQVMYLTDDDVEYLKGKNVMLIDDVFGRGGTTKGLMTLVEKAGAKVTAHAVIGIEEGTNTPRGLIYLFDLPVL